MIETIFSWQGGDDPDPDDTVTFDVYFEAYDTTPDVLLCSNLPSTSKTCDPGVLDFDTPFYWQVIARDDRGKSTAGPVWWFRTLSEEEPPPSDPDLDLLEKYAPVLFMHPE